MKNKLKQLKDKLFKKAATPETNGYLSELIISYLLLVAGVLTALIIHTLIFGGL